MKELIIESLTLCGSDAILLAIDGLREDSKVHFVAKLEDCGYVSSSPTA